MHTNSMTLRFIAQLNQNPTAEETFKYPHIRFFPIVQRFSGI